MTKHGYVEAMKAQRKKRLHIPAKQPRELWKMPMWMWDFVGEFANTGREPTIAAIEELYNGNADPLINLPLSTIQFGVKSQVALLYGLRRRGFIS